MKNGRQLARLLSQTSAFAHPYLTKNKNKQKTKTNKKHAVLHRIWNKSRNIFSHGNFTFLFLFSFFSIFFWGGLIFLLLLFGSFSFYRSEHFEFFMFSLSIVFGILYSTFLGVSCDVMFSNLNLQAISTVDFETLQIWISLGFQATVESILLYGCTT